MTQEELQERILAAEEELNNAQYAVAEASTSYLALCRQVVVDTDHIKQCLANGDGGDERVWSITALHRNAIAVLKIGGSYRDFAVYITAGDDVGLGHAAAAQRPSGVKVHESLCVALFGGATENLYRLGLTWRK